MMVNAAMGMLFALILGVFITRPYRCLTTNIIYMVGLIGVFIQIFFIMGIVKKYEQSIFIDRYYMMTSCVLNGFVWFLVLCAIISMSILKTKWPVHREFCYDIMDGSELAIFHVKSARYF